jgi:flagellar basal body P-ring protein FlgI
MRATRTLIGRGVARRRWAQGVFGLLMCLLVLGASCKHGTTPSTTRIPREVEVPPYLKDTVGELAKVAGRELIQVQGYGFVTGLDGTGTKAMPPGLRREILDVMRKRNVYQPEKLLASPNNAVVMVSGWLTPGIADDEHFDLDVRAVPTTDTTSLEGGFLLDCDLTRVAVGRAGEQKSEPLAVGRGSIFVPPASSEDKSKMAGDPRVGRILAGGRATKTRHFRLLLDNPSSRTADQMVRLINTRFPDSATGTEDPGRVNLAVPKEYQDDKLHFLDLVGAQYLRESADARDARLRLLADTLEAGKDVDRVALSLESFGGAALPHLRRLADQANPTVRFHVGRTLASLQDAYAVIVLEPLALDDQSEFQEMAVEALGKIASGQGQGVLGRALNTRNARVRLAAWQALTRLAPRTFVVHNYAEKFKLSVVPTKADPFIYIAQTMTPEIAIFGDVSIRPPVLAETRRILATAVDGSKTLTVISRLHERDFQIETPLNVRGFIEKAAAPMALDRNDQPLGLELDYGDVLGLLLKMSQRQALGGPIVLQPLKYRIPGDRPTARPIGEAEFSDIDVGSATAPGPGGKPRPKVPE